MPIRTLEPRLQEAIRIRAGYRGPANKNGKRPPAASETFILTSALEPLMERCAEIYGGTVEPWDDAATHSIQWRVVTDRRHLDVLLPPAPNVWSQWMERWTAAGCLRRCDGQFDSISGAACDCPTDWQERRKLAGTGAACKETTRLTVLLREIPELVGARVESHSYHTAIEMLATVPYFAHLAYERGVFVPGRLAIEQRRGQMVPGQPTPQFKVVSFLPDMGAALDVAQLAGGAPHELGPVTGPSAPAAEAASQNVAYPPRDTTTPPPAIAELLVFAEQHGVRQSDLLKIANDLCREQGIAPPTTIAALADHPLLPAVIQTIQTTEAPF